MLTSGSANVKGTVNTLGNRKCLAQVGSLTPSVTRPVIVNVSCPGTVKYDGHLQSSPSRGEGTRDRDSTPLPLPLAGGGGGGSGLRA